MKFQPLSMQRLIRDDRSLTATEKTLLLCGVLRTDNLTRRVRASLQRLAEDAGVGYRTARRAFAPGNTTVLRYFEMVERGPRHVNLTFAYPDNVPEPRSELATAAVSSSGDPWDQAAVMAPEVVPVTVSCGQSGQPSASLSLPSAPQRVSDSRVRGCAAGLEAGGADEQHAEAPAHVAAETEPAHAVRVWGPRQRLERPSIGGDQVGDHQDDRSFAGRGPRAYRRRSAS